MRTVNRMIRLIEEIGLFVLPLARGELAAPLPSPENRMARPLLEMHGPLAQLTRQTQEIARGDYSPRIDFMGAFSEAFNSMVMLLEERERSLTDEIVRRKQAEADLQSERDLLVSGPVVTFRWGIDDEGTVQYVSPNIGAYGYAAEEFLSGRHTYASVVDPADIDWINEDGNDKARSGSKAGRRSTHHRRRRRHALGPRLHAHRPRNRPRGDSLRGLHHRHHAPEEGRAGAPPTRGTAPHALAVGRAPGLYNRRGFFALGEQAMRVARRRSNGLGVISVNVDGLEAVNDRYGHAQGDGIVRTVADVIRASIRESDVAGRVGGDEFVILADDGREITGDLVARLQRRVARYNGRSGRPLRLSLSIGAVEWETGDEVTCRS